MALVLILFVLIIAMGCGVLACRLIMADNGQARYVETAPASGRLPVPVPVSDRVDRVAVAPEQGRGQLLYFTKHVPEGYAKLGEPEGASAP